MSNATAAPKGITALIYRDALGTDFSNQGISARVMEVTVIGEGIDPVFEATEERPAVWPLNATIRPLSAGGSCDRAQTSRSGGGTACRAPLHRRACGWQSLFGTAATREQEGTWHGPKEDIGVGRVAWIHSSTVDEECCWNRKLCARHNPDCWLVGRGQPVTRQNLSPRTGRPLVVFRNSSRDRWPLRNSRRQAGQRSWPGVATLVLHSFRAHSRIPSTG
ncbi:hypothetical protein ACLRGI_10270 [Paenarthrobacter nitroguajacolicus]|uniref:hypothetical protein n=1 Tax=Paenarthrobacter nitroguajacolicus TaxID=211146 RepID=UPI003AE3054F